MLKIFDSTAVDSSDDEDGMDYLSKSFSGEVDWLFSGETTNCKKLSLDYIVGLNYRLWHMLKFRVCPFI